jgi:hypothetical protein
MSTGVVIQLMVLAGFLANVLAAWINFRATNDVHTLINSRMTELLELTRKAAKAEGQLVGEAKRQADDDHVASEVHKASPDTRPKGETK